jgi:hypothetical protein
MLPVGYNAFYCLNNRAGIFRTPRFKMHQVAEFIPQQLRGEAFKLYFIDQHAAWDDDPTYILDEWVAYINGVTVGKELIKAGMYGEMAQFHKDIRHSLELAGHASALLAATKKFDPTYPDYQKLADFVGFNLQRAVRLTSSAEKTLADAVLATYAPGISFERACQFQAPHGWYFTSGKVAWNRLPQENMSDVPSPVATERTRPNPIHSDNSVPANKKPIKVAEKSVKVADKVKDDPSPLKFVLDSFDKRIESGEDRVEILKEIAGLPKTTTEDKQFTHVGPTE